MVGAATDRAASSLQFPEYTKVHQKKVLGEGTLTDAGDKQVPNTPGLMESLNCGWSLPANATRSQAFLR
jgi:hypothetical protein